MTTDALTDAVLDEAEAIVRAEWLRLQHDEAPPERAPCAVGSEMPAARPRPVTAATVTATVERSRPTPPRRRTGWPFKAVLQQPVWPTQRSPPQHGGVMPNSVEHREVMP
ncbi:MAG: hypothetical protein QOD90_2310 [Mycobacterium sp.]|jgi:hypothetical protein|nr:hypothetical protein [Mycobacterium sp.]